MIRVLVVDDSAFMRKVLADMLGSDPDIQVIAVAHDGKDAIDKVNQFNPDVITLDMNLPDIDGLDVIRTILKKTFVPIVMISAYAKKDSVLVLNALKLGAVDFVTKNSGSISLDIEDQKDVIISKVKAASNAKMHLLKPKKKALRHNFFTSREKVIVIGTSTGGPQTLEALLSELPKNIPAPVLVVQHMPPDFTKVFADRLNKVCDIEIREAKQDEIIEDGVVLIAPGGFHMELKQDEGKTKISLNKLPPELGVRPNANRLFRSAAGIFGENTIGVVLTGMGSDGTVGSSEIKKNNGTIIAQSEDTCIIYGMPKSVFDAGYVDMVLPLDKMAVALLQLLEV